MLTDDVSLANVYEENCVNDNHCDSTKMSPVEGPVNDIPKTMFDKSHDLSGDTTTTTHQGEGCEQFSGQIVYNPDGSAYIIEENDETLLDQIPTQEGSIVERAGKCLPEVEYPKIDQVDMSQIFFIDVANILSPVTRRSTSSGGRRGTSRTCSCCRAGARVRTVKLRVRGPTSTTSRW